MQNDNVVTLAGVPLQPAKASDQCCEVLAGWLEAARSGEIIGVAIAVFHHDRRTTTELAGEYHRRTMAGAIFDLLSDARGE